MIKPYYNYEERMQIRFKTLQGDGFNLKLSFLKFIREIFGRLKNYTYICKEFKN